MKMENNQEMVITPDTEISLHQILQIFVSRWRYLMILALIFIIGAVGKHKFFPQYPAKGKIIIKDSKNSQLYSFLNSVVGSLGGNSIAKGYSSNSLAVARLETNDFFLKFADRIILINSAPKTEVVFKKALGSFFSELGVSASNKDFRQIVADRMRGYLSFSTLKGGQVVFRVKTGVRAFSVILVNSAVDVAKETLTGHEISDFIRAERYFEMELRIVQEKLEQLESDTVFKMRESKVLSVESERGETSKYLNKLKKEINDTKMKISENRTILKDLKKKKGKSKKTTPESLLGKFDISTQIKQINDEIRQLNIRLKTLQKHLKKFGGQSKGLLSFQNEIEKMKANYMLEYKVYEGLRDKLARIGLLKTYLENNIEILEKDRIRRVKSYPKLSMMILLAIMLSQVIGFGGIYLFELFRPHVIIKKDG